MNKLIEYLNTTTSAYYEQNLDLNFSPHVVLQKIVGMPDQRQRIKMWLTYQGLGLNLPKDDYIKSLSKMPLFPCGSFYQIQLDVPRLGLREDSKETARRMFDAYSKRNAVSNYV